MKLRGHKEHKEARRALRCVLRASLCSLCPILLLFISCSSDHKQQPEPRRAFYYWKSVYKNNSYEQQRLKELNANTLYIKFFDVDWNYETKQPFPLARINFIDTPSSSLQIIPVVFITNRCINQMDSANVPALAANIAVLIHQLAPDIYASIPEIQIDCDWTEGTRNKYFSFLQLLRKHELLKGKILSVTLRLHQIKYKNVTGIPPADRGLLMAYNMGNLKDIETRNSILDTEELKRYTGKLGEYPMKLDVALPLFSWYAWFKADKSFKGLVYDTVGLSREPGDLLRKEESSVEEIVKAGHFIRERITNDQRTLSCFHLDSIILKKYPNHDLEKIFNCLHD